jgi:hypothetical protein
MSKKIIDFIKKVLRFLFKITIIPLKMTGLFIFKQIKRLFKFIVKIFEITKNHLYYTSEKHRMNKSASHGFGLYKNIRIADGKTAKNLVKIIKKDSVKKQKPLEKSKKKI